MKKNIIYAHLLLIMVVLSFSCKKDFLNRNPLDKISSETFWKNEADLRAALAGCYAILSPRDNPGFGALAPHYEGLSDNAYDNFPWEGGFTTLAQGIITPNSGGAVATEYNLHYQQIAADNFLLDNIDKVPVDDAIKAKYKAESRFLRAYSYFRLSEAFGGVILSLKVETLSETKRPKNTKAEVVAAILDDLDFAIANLPDQAYAGNAVKGSAQALKAKVLLYNEKWKESAAVSKAIIDGAKFSLSPEYSNLFIKPGQLNNPEIIFSARYQTPDAYSNMDIYYSFWQSLQPLKLLVDAYETIDGSPINPADPYSNRDPRLKKTILLPGEPHVGSSTGIFMPFAGDNKTGYLPKKFVDPNLNAQQTSNSDCVILRYSDVLLMYAEAQNEDLGPEASVYDAVNKVRQRPGINMPVLPIGLSKEQMRERIRKERRIEFAMEGTRYFDLKRWHIAHIVLPTVVDPGGIKRSFAQKNYLWPFPQAEINILSPNLVQNDDY